MRVPGHKFTFGVAKAAQARGDFQVLAERQDLRSGLAKLDAVAKEALM